MIAGAVPIVDFGPFHGTDVVARRAVADHVYQACKDVGFLCLRNHGVPLELVDRLFDEAKRFFGQPRERKEQVHWTGPGRPGYLGVEAEYLNPDKPGDLKETYTASTRASATDPLGWPEGLPGFRETVLEFRDVASGVCGDIMHAFAMAFGLPEAYFDSLHGQHYSSARLLHYPPLPAEYLPGQIRAGAHTDYGTVTLLFQESDGGLEIFREGQWLPAPCIPGTVIVNTGDLMERWTNNELKSTQHRVVNPVGPAAQRSRYSATLFYNPNFDAEISCLEPFVSTARPALYPPITTGDHLLACINASR